MKKRCILYALYVDDLIYSRNNGAMFEKCNIGFH